MVFVCLPACDYIALAATVKVLMGSPKMPQNVLVSLCTSKVLQEVNFPKDVWGCCARERLQLCIDITVILCSVGWRQSRGTNSELHIFSNFVAV